MQYPVSFFKVLLFAFSIDLVAGHGAIIAATGDAGGQGMALGIDASTPRDGTRRNPFQQDTTIFGRQSTGCGRTLQGGQIDISAAMDEVISQSGGLPQVTAGGSVTMTLHQINADGAGPYTCMIDMTGTGANFQPLTVTTQVPGRRGRDRNGSATDFPLVASLPANMACTGSAGTMTGICMVRCQNPARAGPFGGCVPVQQVTDTTPPVQEPPAPVTPPVASPPPAVVAPPVSSEAPQPPEQSLVPLARGRNPLSKKSFWRA